MKKEIGSGEEQSQRMTRSNFFDEYYLFHKQPRLPYKPFLSRDPLLPWCDSKTYLKQRMALKMSLALVHGGMSR